jgi:creatinine amidohydrolase/Fe(II)-dependent formamide hydrolase-like protein
MTERHLARMTWMEIRDLDKQEGAVVLPFGSLEQHGPHLSIDTDLYFADRFLDLALAKLGEDVACWRLPILPISRSGEHVGFPGSLWLTSETLLKVIEEITAGIAASGFRRVVLLNCHGGNIALLEVAARDVRVRTGLMAFTLFPPALLPDPVEVDERERVFGIHANDWETSVMLELSPERVRPERRDVSYPQFESETLRLEGAAANVAWASRDLVSSGTFGDARSATAERGRARIDPMIDRLAAVLAEISRFEMPTPAP